MYEQEKKMAEVGKGAGNRVDHPNQRGNGNHYDTIRVVTKEGQR